MALIAAVALLALVLLLSLLLDEDDSRSSTDPRNDPRVWFALARR